MTYHNPSMIRTETAIVAGVRVIASILATVSAISVTAVMTVAVGSSTATTMAAVFPPWWSASKVFQAAASAGEIVDVGRVPSMIVVRSDRGALAARLKAAGALATLSADESGGCRTFNAGSKK